jgi:glycosyltransferase involved in cell wall biosynthesis
MPRPKLAIITEIIAPYRIPVFNALAKNQDIDLHVLFLSENDPTLRQWQVYKEEIEFRYQVLPSWRRRFAGYNILLNCGVSSALSLIQPDVIVCGGYNYLACWAAAYWARTRRIPFLLWTESTALDWRRSYGLIEFLKRRFLNLCSGYVVPGKSSHDYLAQLGVAEDRISVARNAVDNTLFSSLAQSARQNALPLRSHYHLPGRYFLFVGRFVKEKGIFDLLDAYAQLPAATSMSIALVLVGDGPDRRDLLARAAKVSSGTVRVLEFLQREDLAQIYALAEVLIFPTHSDPWGLVVNEAMACGLPLITTDVAGCAPDLVHDGGNGLIVPSHNPSRLADAMEKLAAGPALRARMASQSQAVIELYSPTKWAQGMAQAVQSALARPQKSS